MRPSARFYATTCGVVGLFVLCVMTAAFYATAARARKDWRDQTATDAALAHMEKLRWEIQRLNYVRLLRAVHARRAGKPLADIRRSLRKNLAALPGPPNGLAGWNADFARISRQFNAVLNGAGSKGVKRGPGELEHLQHELAGLQTLQRANLVRWQRQTRREDGVPMRLALVGAALRILFVIVCAVLLYQQFSRQKRARAALRQHAERLTKILRILAEIGSSDAEYTMLMRQIMDHAQNLIPAAGGVTILFSDGDDLITRFASPNFQHRVGVRMGTKSVAGEALRTGAVTVCNDTLGSPMPDQRACRETKARSLMSIPMRYNGKVLGTFSLISEIPNAFSHTDQSEIELIAALLANAVTIAAEMREKQSLLTQRTAAMVALQKSEQRFATFMLHSPHLCLVKDSAGRYQYINHMATPTLFASPTACLGKTDSELFSSRVARVLHQGDEEILAGTPMVQYRQMVPGHQGAPSYWMFTKFQMNEPGKERSIGVICADVTSLAKAEIALKESEARYREIIENGYDMICEINPAGQYVYVSPNYYKTTGYQPEELLGRSALTNVHPEDVSAVHQQMIRAIREESNCCMTFRSRRKDGQWRWFETHGQSFRTAGGEQRGVVITRDVTDRVDADMERIAREKLQREKNSLTDAVGAMDQVLGVVGHELRTPLAGIRAMTELLLTAEVREADQQQHFLSAMNTEVIRMAEMVNNILEAARLNSGTAKWNWGDCTLRKIAMEALDTVRPLIGENKVALECVDVPPDLVMLGDEAAIRRLLINLVNNACKNTRAGFVRIACRRETAADGPRVIIDVEDSGAGIPAHVAAKLGQAFALNSGVVGADHIRGTGLGLAICKGITAAHGGLITIESTEGRGTKISVSLRSDLEAPVASGGCEMRILAGSEK